MMEARLVVFCLLAAAANSYPQNIMDRPFLRRAVRTDATIRCCYYNQDTVNVFWRQTVTSNKTCTARVVNETLDARVEMNSTVHVKNTKVTCSYLTISNLMLNDTGLYQCAVIESNTTFFTPGTYLQVYVPTQKILDIEEGSKNSIITAEGVLLLMFVLIPGTILICKSKSTIQLEKRKSNEDENIYEGLNLDECNSTYHQIQRSLVQGTYQDVINNQEDRIQLEKP